MLVLEALYRLGLKWEQQKDRTAILKAYKCKMLEFHPDKNPNPLCTKIAQEINQAKDALLRELSDDDESSKTTENARCNEDEFKKKMAEWEEEKRVWEEKYDAMEKERIRKRRERYARNRKKRAPDSRIHRKIDTYPEGKKLIEDMTSFFEKNLETSSNFADYVYVSQLLEMFMRSRDSNSQLDNALFKRHCKTILAKVLPKAEYAQRKSKRCYVYLQMKKT